MSNTIGIFLAILITVLIIVIMIKLPINHPSYVYFDNESSNASEEIIKKEISVNPIRVMKRDPYYRSIYTGHSYPISYPVYLPRYRPISIPQTPIRPLLNS